MSANGGEDVPGSQCEVDNIFGLGSGRCDPLLRDSYIGGLALVGTLLLLVTTLLVTICCLATKLKKTKR